MMFRFAGYARGEHPFVLAKVAGRHSVLFKPLAPLIP